jgi:thioredoxin reductase (NADPH)
MNDGVGRRAILVVHGDEGRRELLVAHLRRRYGVDYTEITDGRGHGRLEELDLRDRRSRAIETVPAAELFVMIGAEPRTAWLGDAVRRDDAAGRLKLVRL